MTNHNLQTKLNMDDRRQQVKELLAPDEIRNHRVTEGLKLSPEQVIELDQAANVASQIAQGLHELSRQSLDADQKDPIYRKVRQMLKLEGKAQARMRGEIDVINLPTPQITKVDLILTDDGMRIVEIEPGKIRGIGYGAMVRQQSPESLGLGADTYIADLADNELVAIVMSDADRFHEPEIGILNKLNEGILVAPQMDTEATGNGLSIKRGHIVAKKAVMMSMLVNKGASEVQVRNVAEIISDRREDLELKTALAMIHNSDEDMELEQLLVEVFSSEVLSKIRNIVPTTTHASQMTNQSRDSLASKLLDGDGAVFLKPISASGTRGIITPDNTLDAVEVLKRPKELKKFVVQQAHKVTMVDMVSKDVLNGTENHTSMNIRITLHVDNSGNIIEASAVGSPDEHLAHGGKTSVITSVERGSDV
jgi:hypothetical protein